MATYWRNVSPYGALDIPLLGRTVEAGEVFEVTPEQAKHLAGQDDNFQKVQPSKTAKERAAKKAEDAAPAVESTSDEGAI